MAERSEVLGLAAQIVSAHVSQTAVPSARGASLIRQVTHLPPPSRQQRCHKNRNLRSP